MGGMIGGIAGAQAAQNGQDAALQARQQALAQFLGVNVPSVASQSLDLAQYQNAGDLGIQNEQALQQGPTAMAGISTDPRLAQAQMSALQQLSTTGQMGMTPAQQAALAQAQQAAASQGQAKNAQIMDQFARTGMGGSGAQLAAQLSASQGQSNQLAGNSNQIAQNAQQNAMQAMAQAGQLGGQMQGQQFGQQAQIAQAKDYINRFNTENSQQVQNANTQAANAAALRNLQNKQSLMGQNTGLQNYQQEHNKGLIQQQYNNQMARASGLAGQYQGIAENNQTNAGRTADMYAGAGRGLDTGVGSLYNAYNRRNRNNNASDYGSAGQPSASNNGYGAGAYGPGLSESEMNGGMSPTDQASRDEEDVYGEF